MLVDALLETTAKLGPKEAVADQTLQLSFKRLTAMAAAFRRIILDADPGEKMGIMLPSSAVFPAVLFGSLWANKTALPLNFLLSADELKHIVDDAGLTTVLSVRHFEKLLAELPVRAIFLEDLPLKRKTLAASILPKPSSPKVSPSDTAVLLYTSGTSAKPKGVELSYQNLYSNCRGCIEAARMDPAHTFLNILPPFHVFGLTGNVLIPAVLGAGVYAIPRFQPAAAIKAIQDRRLSIMLAIPSMYAAILRNKSAPKDALSSVYLALSGGEPLPEAVAAGFEQRFGVKLHQGYGLTETSPVISVCAPNSHRDRSVGRLIPGVGCKIVDEDGACLPANTDGEVIVQGPCVMKGYYRKPEETAAVLDADGWFRTGDLGQLDDDGFLFITGRKKEMLIVGGENVAPAEIESILVEHPAVSEAAVIGRPDTSRGEVPIAFVVLTDETEAKKVNEQDLRNFARQHLAGYKVPKRVHIAEDLPRGPTGKILKRKLAEPD